MGKYNMHVICGQSFQLPEVSSHLLAQRVSLVLEKYLFGFFPLRDNQDMKLLGWHYYESP